MTKIDRTNELIALIERKATDATEAAARAHNEGYKARITAVQNNLNEEGTGFLPPHSQSGEFHDMETGQAARNLDVERGHLESGSGVRGERFGFGPFSPTHDVAGGLHTIYLTATGRLGMDDSFVEDQAIIEEAARQALQC